MVCTTNVQRDDLRVNFNERTDLGFFKFPSVAFDLDAFVLLVEHILHVAVNVVHLGHVDLDFALYLIVGNGLALKVRVHIRNVRRERFLDFCDSLSPQGARLAHAWNVNKVDLLRNVVVRVKEIHLVRVFLNPHGDVRVRLDAGSA